MAKKKTQSASSLKNSKRKQVKQNGEIKREEDSASKNKDSNETTKTVSKIDVQMIMDALIDSMKEEPPENATKNRDELIKKYLVQRISEHEVASNYNILLLYDEGRMMKSDADNIYTAATKFKERKPLLLVLYSTGGTIDSAYLIGKLCREYSNGKFIVVVPRQAKSAATLICCAADEIHMGSLSELGPIDPQIDRLPALGLKNSVEHIADLSQKYPKSADMFARYLNLSLNPIHLGYYERVAESATQYAARLLKTNTTGLKSSPEKIANELVYSYKDHSFVIDKSEAIEIFGSDIVKHNSAEYKLGNSVYETLMYVSKIADLMNHYFYFIGSCDTNPTFVKRKKR